jgi:hypothetical protein
MSEADMSLPRTVIVVLTLLASIAAPAARAQGRQLTETWPPDLEAGRSVRVVTGTAVASALTGKVVDVSDAGLRLRQGMDVRTIPRGDIRRIEVGDSLWNGTVTGALVGAASLGVGYAVLSALVCPDCGDADAEFVNSLEWAALGGTLGAVVGLAIDALIDGRRTIYVAPVVSVSPPRSPRPFGAVVRVSW